jgi:hypothetical protein
MAAPTPEEILARLAKRVKRMSTDDLMLWAETATAGMMRQLDDFRHSPDQAHLAEIRLAAVSMDAVCEEISIRLEQSKSLT